MSFNTEIFNAELLESIAHLQQQLTAANEQIKELEVQLDHSRLYQTYLRGQLFGKRSERRAKKNKFNPNQLTLFDLPETPESTQEEEITVPEHKRRKKKRKKSQLPANRDERFPKHLPREVITLEPDSCSCPSCNQQMKHLVKTEITEKLCCSRDPFYVEQYRKPVYSCRDCNKITLTAKVDEVFTRSSFGESTVAFLAVNKFKFHLPLHRQAKMFTDWGVPFSRDTFIHVLKQGYELLQPVIKELKASVLSSYILQGDDTKVNVKLDNEYDKRPIWSFLGDKKEVFYQFAPARTHQSCNNAFGDFKGKVFLADGYDGFERLVESLGSNVILANCNIHARRYFIKAEKYAPNFAAYAIEIYKKLSMIEREAKGKPPNEVLAIREKKAVPILNDKFKPWLDKLLIAEPLESPLGKAVAYVITRWESLTAYTKDPNIPFSTNELEGQIRAIAVGRKNWLHASSELGAHVVAGYFSLVGTCSLHNIDPFYYLADVFRRVGEHKASDAYQLTPREWKVRFEQQAIQLYASPFSKSS